MPYPMAVLLGLYKAYPSQVLTGLLICQQDAVRVTQLPVTLAGRIRKGANQLPVMLDAINRRGVRKLTQIQTRGLNLEQSKTCRLSSALRYNDLSSPNKP